VGRPTPAAGAGPVATLGVVRLIEIRLLEGPNLYRLEFTYEGTKSVFAFDGKAGWQVVPLQGRFEPEAMPPEADGHSAAHRHHAGCDKSDALRATQTA